MTGAEGDLFFGDGGFLQSGWLMCSETCRKVWPKADAGGEHCGVCTGLVPAEVQTPHMECAGHFTLGLADVGNLDQQKLKRGLVLPRRAETWVDAERCVMAER